jgi:hypothetical protein
VVATDIIQRDSTNMWAALVVIQLMYTTCHEPRQLNDPAFFWQSHARDALQERMERNILHDALLFIVACFSILKRNELPVYIFGNIISWILRTAPVLGFDVTVADEFKLWWFSPTLATNDSEISEMGETDFLAYWANVSGERDYHTLFEFLKAVMSATMTEASVERCFSRLGHAIDSLRSRISDATVNAQVGITSFADCLAGIGDTTSTPSPSRKRLTREFLLWVVHFTLHMEQSQPEPARVVTDDAACGVCGLPDKKGKHATGTQWVACDKCLRWFALPCLGIANSQKAMMESGSWYCDACSAKKRARK